LGSASAAVPANARPASAGSTNVIQTVTLANAPIKNGKKLTQSVVRNAEIQIIQHATIGNLTYTVSGNARLEELACDVKTRIIYYSPESGRRIIFPTTDGKAGDSLTQTARNHTAKNANYAKVRCIGTRRGARTRHSAIAASALRRI